MTLRGVLLARLTVHIHHVDAAFLAGCLGLILFIGSFLTGSVTASAAFAYSTTSATNASTTNTVGKEEIPSQVKNFILDQIVNKSKAAIVIGFVDPNGTRIFSFGNMSTAHNVPVNQSTLFNIGSITKTFTTLLLADMVKQGLVNLTDPIEKYLPTSVKVPQFHGQKITLEELATHTSGLPNFPSDSLDNNGELKSNYSAAQLYQALSNTILGRAPGSQYEYSTFGSGLLGHILSKVAGISYEQLVKDRILDVLGMYDTKIALSQNEINDRFPVGHKGGKEIVIPPIPTVLAGAGAFRSTAADLLKYVSANLGLIHTQLDDAMQLQHLIRHPAMDTPFSYSKYVGLGWMILTDFGSETIFHHGQVTGWHAFAGFIPTKQIGIVAMCSCDITDAGMLKLGLVLLHLEGTDKLSSQTNTTSTAATTTTTASQNSTSGTG
jgi:serine-type D-Ala-D-Ala carboxypeptidase/endopeptidase